MYQLLQQAEQQVFGHSNAAPFSIRTPLAERDPRAIQFPEVLAERSGTNRRILRLEAALDLAVQHSREYQTQKEQLYLAALSLTGARYQFSPQFFGSSTARVGGSPDGTQSGSVSSRIGVNQLLRTGGRLSVSLGNDLLRYFTGWSSGPNGGSRDSAINSLSVELTQPLLRGFGRNDPTVENLTQAERNVVYAVRSFSQYQRQFAVNIVNDYFGLLGLKDVVRNNYTNYLRRVETSEYLSARSVDRVRKSDVDDARSAELSARISYIDSVAQYLNELAAFKLTLGVPLTEELFVEDTDLAELLATGLIPVEAERLTAFRLAVDHHFDILNAIDRFEDSKRKVRLAADQLKPGIGFVGNATLESESPYDYANFDLQKVRYSAGLTFDLPLDRLRERNTYRAALVSFESQVRSLGLTLDNFRDRIERGLRTLEQRRLTYLNRQMALDVARRRVEMNSILLNAGRVQIRDLRESQDSLISAQNQMTSTLVAYLQARLQLLLDIGVLQTEVPKFWLQDPLARQLTPEMRGPSPLSMPGEALQPPDQFLQPVP